MALPQKRPLNISTKEFKKQKNTNKNLSSANVIVAMKNIYNENHTNSTDTTNKNDKGNGNGSIPEVSKQKFLKKRKKYKK